MVPPTTEQFWFVPAYIFLWLAVLLAGALFVYRVSILSRLLLAAKPDGRHKEVGERVRALIVYFLAQARLFKYPGAGLMHALIFWGFLILSLGTIETFGKGLFAGSFALPLLDGNPSFLLSLDAFTVLVIGAVLVAAFRRLVVRRREARPQRDDRP